MSTTPTVPATTSEQIIQQIQLDNAHIGNRQSRISPVIFAGMVRLGEFALLGLCGLALASAWVGFHDAFEDTRYLTAIFATAFAAVVAAHRLELYTIGALTAPLRSLPRVAVAWTTAMALLVGTIFLLKAGIDYSRAWLLFWYVGGFAGLAGFRYWASASMQRWSQQGRLNRHAVIYGAGPEGEALVAALEADKSSDVRICGIFDDRGSDRAGPIGGHHRVGNVNELITYCRTQPVDVLIVSLPISAEARLLEILKKLWVLPVDIRLAAHTNKLRFRPRAYSFIGNVPLIDIFDKPLADWDSLVKGVFDKMVAAAAVVALAPVMALVALAVKLDSKGPVLFRQKRLGFNNELVDVFKFRSMYTDMSDVNAAQLVTKGDPRVTKVGRFIRKTSLDELPQLFNVLTGSLSLVGPRPHALMAKADNQLYHEVVDGYFARHKVKPGITGWAQINGWRGETDTSEKIQKRVEHDLYYIENWSLFFDIYILLKTPLSLLKSENAY
ncbi:MAG: undecaprenyl-phosphate glucose phosphotransferase [Hyphomicrobiaceae bacterium]